MIWNLLARGNYHPEVGNLQRFLKYLAFTDADGNTLEDDEHFGGKTMWALSKYQESKNIARTGTFTSETRAHATVDGFVPFISSTNQTSWGKKSRVVDVLVVHVMQFPERKHSALDVALWFGGKSPFDPPRASAHYCVDSLDTIQCVRDNDEAWHAEGINPRSIGIELAGFSEQTEEQWKDDYSILTLGRAAKLMGRLARVHDIPVNRLKPSEIALGVQAGICGHMDVTYSGLAKSGHMDPGPNFPWKYFLNAVEEAKVDV